MSISTKCDYCKLDIQIYKGELRYKKHYCSKQCRNKGQITKVNIECKNCSKIVLRTKSDSSGNRFCSVKCSAIYNNKLHTKRKKKEIEPKNCPWCTKIFATNNKYCDECISQKICYKENPVTNDRTIESMLGPKNDANRYNYIRIHARKTISNREKICAICRYSMHVEVCHIKDISNFPLLATLGEVNSEDNLILLCRNHHWELDNGHLQLGRQEVESCIPIKENSL